MSHIFRIANEIGGENYQEKYTKENMGNTPRYWNSDVGYKIWSEFIADYIAAELNPYTEFYSLADLREIVCELDEKVNYDDPDRAVYCSSLLFYIFSNQKIRTAKNADAAFRLLQRHQVLETKERRADHRKLFDLIFNQLQKGKKWMISYEFIEEVGRCYIGLIQF